MKASTDRNIQKKFVRITTVPVKPDQSPIRPCCRTISLAQCIGPLNLRSDACLPNCSCSFTACTKARPK